MARAAIEGLGRISAFFFPRAGLYPACDRAQIRERVSGALFPCSERHLQCVWFDPGLRPANLQTETGESVVVEDPGSWNLEAGPDFLGAALRIGPELRRITGDVEVHLRPSDWDGHRHARDPRYRHVRVHVTYLPGLPPTSALPPGAVRIALRDALAANPAFSFDSIDLIAYPYGNPGTPPPCRVALKDWPMDDKVRFLEAAGEERMRRKAERLAAAIDERGADQALYEEILWALGFKHNKVPFRQLAAQLPLAALRAESGGDPRIAYALLLGVAGLLPAKLSPKWDPPTRTFIRGLWDAWWRRQERWERRQLAPTEWRLAGLRPTNRPERRLMAAAVLFTRTASPAEEWRTLTLESAKELLESVSDPYWDRRLSFSGAPAAKRIALIGSTRADAILNNVFVPFLAAQDVHAPFRAGLLSKLEPEEDNEIVKRIAFSIFGPDFPPSLTRSGLRQQGLLQIFHDYCLNDRSRCASCPLPGLLKR